MRGYIGGLSRCKRDVDDFVDKMDLFLDWTLKGQLDVNNRIILDLVLKNYFYFLPKFMIFTITVTILLIYSTNAKIIQISNRILIKQESIQIQDHNSQLITNCKEH